MILMLLTPLVLLPAAPSPSPACVGYRAVKTVVFGFDVEVVGESCNVDLRVRQIQPWHLVLEAEIAVATFDSDHALRDRHVAELFEERSVRFLSKPLPLHEIEALLGSEQFTLTGTLELAGTSSPVDLAVELGPEVVSASTEINLASFEIEPPSMGPFGMAGRVHDTVTLSARVGRTQLRSLLYASMAADPTNAGSKAELGDAR